MSTKDAYVKKMHAKLDEWNADIDKLKAKAGAAQADAKQEYYKQIEQLELKQNEANQKLDDLKTAGDEAWEDLKAGVDLAWESVSMAVKSAISRFN
jgi:multidrug resistance efflux pump